MRYAVEQPTSIFAEAVRSIRLAVLRVARTQATQVVMVIIDSEGRTTLAANLALSFATMGVRTILVEGDLRNPEMSRSLCPHARFSLLEAATGEVPLNQAIVVEPSTRLAILPAPPPQNAALQAEFDAVGRHGNDPQRAPAIFRYDRGRCAAAAAIGRRPRAGEGADSILLAIGWDRTPQDVVVRALDLIAPVQDLSSGS